MKTTQYTYAPNNMPMHINQQLHFSNVWGPDESHLFFTSTDTQPSHAAPFFSQQSFATEGNRANMQASSNFSSTSQLSASRQMIAPSRALSSMPPRQGRALAQMRQNPPPAKRQRLEPYATEAIYFGRMDSCENRAGPATAPSECCSSCPEGEPCTEPNCAPWDKLDLNKNISGIVPCNRQSCAEAACPDACLAACIQNQQVYDTVGPESIGDWVDATWDPQLSGNSKSRESHRIDGIFDPQLGGFDKAECPSASASPAPTTPSMGNNVETPFSPSAELPTPQFSSVQQQVAQNAYPTQSTTTLQGAGMMFNPPTEQWPSQSFGQFSNESSLFHCTWDGCGQMIMNSHDLLPHLHSQHIDPQMTFNCPIQEESCPPTINDNPLNHLQKDHGYNFDLGGGNIGCPDPTCVQGGEVFCNPAMLHHHFDSYHATPNHGSFQCQLDTCNTFFQGLEQLQSHFIDDHQLPLVPPKDDDLNLQLTDPVSRPSKDKLDLSNTEDKGTPVPEIPHRCKWNDHDSICGKICTSEDDLQTHLKNDHLSVLDKSSGYRCQWEGCVREKARGEEKSGFSQRGKLERHMATHTNFKCCKCDVCGQTFSAQQSLAQHKLLHTGEKPWKCGHCGKAFPQQSALTIHERTHTGLKPLKCEICGKAFSESSNLAKHRKIHNKSGENVCTHPGCGKRFVRLDQLKRHMGVHRKKGKYGSVISAVSVGGSDDGDGESVVTRSEVEEDGGD